MEEGVKLQDSGRLITAEDCGLSYTSARDSCERRDQRELDRIPEGRGEAGL